MSACNPAQSFVRSKSCLGQHESVTLSVEMAIFCLHFISSKSYRMKHASFVHALINASEMESLLHDSAVLCLLSASFYWYTHNICAYV